MSASVLIRLCFLCACLFSPVIPSSLLVSDLAVAVLPGSVPDLFSVCTSVLGDLGSSHSFLYLCVQATARATLPAQVCPVSFGRRQPKLDKATRLSHTPCGVERSKPDSHSSSKPAFLRAFLVSLNRNSMLVLESENFRTSPLPPSVARTSHPSHHKSHGLSLQYTFPKQLFGLTRSVQATRILATMWTSPTFSLCPPVSAF